MYVLMITPNNFPNGDAGAVRDYYFAKIYQSLGYEVIHIGMNPNQKRGEIDNIDYYSIYEMNRSYYKKISNLFSYGSRLSNCFDEIFQAKGLPSYTHIYDIPEIGIKKIVELSKKHQISIIHDSVEWYSPCEFKFGKFSYQYILKDRCNKHLIKKPMAVIAISTYLQSYFESKDMKVIRIPIIMSQDSYSPKVIDNADVISLIYAGSPANKDYLEECIKGFLMLPEKERSKFQFNIVGVTASFIKDKYKIEELPKQIVVHGRIDRSEVIKLLRESDFSLLLRPSKERYAKAGFPTKSVEAMVNGCAMLCNLSSDLGMYLNDEVNSILVEECSATAMAYSLQRISQKSREEIEAIKKNAKETAEKYFNYEHYIDDMRVFLSDL